MPLSASHSSSWTSHLSPSAWVSHLSQTGSVISLRLGQSSPSDWVGHLSDWVCHLPQTWSVISLRLGQSSLTDWVSHLSQTESVISQTGSVISLRLDQSSLTDRISHLSDWVSHLSDWVGHISPRLMSGEVLRSCGPCNVVSRAPGSTPGGRSPGLFSELAGRGASPWHHHPSTGRRLRPGRARRFETLQYHQSFWRV